MQWAHETSYNSWWCKYEVVYIGNHRKHTSGGVRELLRILDRGENWVSLVLH